MSKLKAEHAQVEYSSNKEMCLTKTGNMADQVWRQNVNRAFKEFFGLYSMETIEYDQQEFGTIKALITAVNTSTYRVDCVNWSSKIPKSRLFIMGLYKDFNAFFAQHSQFQHLLTKNKLARVVQSIETEKASINDQKQMQKFETSYLPGLASLFVKKQTNGIQTALEMVQSKDEDLVAFPVLGSI